MTNYAASIIQERNAIKKAIAEMPLQELEVWRLYIQGKYLLLKVDQDAS